MNKFCGDKEKFQEKISQRLIFLGDKDVIKTRDSDNVSSQSFNTLCYDDNYTNIISDYNNGYYGYDSSLNWTPCKRSTI